MAKKVATQAQAKAAVAHGDGNFSIEPIAIDAPTGHEVLVEILAAGVCHTDLDSIGWGKPLLMGHEGAGIVHSVGGQVTHVSPGDRVLLHWAHHCGHCYTCQNNLPHLCETISPAAGLAGLAAMEKTRWNGQPIERAFLIGTMATHTLVREEALVKLPDTVPFASACIVGCGVMTGYGSVTNAAKVTPGSSVTVIGCGGVGLNAIQAAAISGASTIIAVDINPNKLQQATQFGATDTLLAQPDDPQLTQTVEQIKQLTEGRGCDYAFECAAIPNLIAPMLSCIRHGGTAVEVSGSNDDHSINLGLFQWDKIFLNPLYGACKPSVDFPNIFSLYQKKKLQLDELITRTYTLDQLADAFDDLKAGKNTKGVLLMNHETPA